MFKVHGHFQAVRTLFDTIQCGCCLKEFHSYGKLQGHLLRAEFCRHTLHSDEALPFPLFLALAPLPIENLRKYMIRFFHLYKLKVPIMLFGAVAWWMTMTWSSSR